MQKAFNLLNIKIAESEFVKNKGAAVTRSIKCFEVFTTIDLNQKIKTNYCLKPGSVRPIHISITLLSKGHSGV